MSSIKKFINKNNVKKDIYLLSHYIFAFGITLVFLFAFSNPTQLSVNQAVLLLLLGLIIGFMDVPRPEANSFILATIAIIVSSLAHYEQINYMIFNFPYPLGMYIKGMLLDASILLSPAMLIVGLKVIYRVYTESR